MVDYESLELIPAIVARSKFLEERLSTLDKIQSEMLETARHNTTITIEHDGIAVKLFGDTSSMTMLDMIENLASKYRDELSRHETSLSCIAEVASAYDRSVDTFKNEMLLLKDDALGKRPMDSRAVFKYCRTCKHYKYNKEGHRESVQECIGCVPHEDANSNWALKE